MNIDDEGPFAREPYSADTILAELVIDPAAQAVLDRLASDLLRASAAFGGGPLPAGMATIFRPRHRSRTGSRCRPRWSRSSTANSRQSCCPRGDPRPLGALRHRATISARITAAPGAAGV